MRLNHQIRIPSVRLLDENGKMIGIVSSYEALKQAQDKGLDLVEIDPNQRPPICKIMNFGKYQYDEAKKKKEIKKASKVLPVKEMQFGPNVEQNDINVKTKQIREFLSEGHKVRLVMKFRGRDLQHTDLGRKVFNGIVESLSDVSKTEQSQEFDGRNLAVTVVKK